MDHPFSLLVFAARPDTATGGLMQGLATAVAWLISHGTAAVLAVLSWSPPLWGCILISLAIIAAGVAWVRWTGRPVKKGGSR